MKPALFDEFGNPVRFYRLMYSLDGWLVSAREHAASISPYPLKTERDRLQPLATKGEFMVIDPDGRLVN